MASTQQLTYHRSGNKGTLKLSGDVDINVATALYDLAQRAFADLKAQSICVEMSHVERLDVATVQVLCALKRDIGAAGRNFHIAGLAAELTDKLNRVGITL